MPNTERYDLSRFIDNNNGIHQFNNKLIKSIKSIPKFSDTKVTGVLRLDNISKSLYGSYQLWWILAIYNNLLNPITTNYNSKELKYPSYSSIENWYFNNKEEFVLSDLYYSSAPEPDKQKLAKQLKNPYVNKIDNSLVLDGGSIT